MQQEMQCALNALRLAVDHLGLAAKFAQSMREELEPCGYCGSVNGESGGWCCLPRHGHDTVAGACVPECPACEVRS